MNSVCEWQWLGCHAIRILRLERLHAAALRNVAYMQLDITILVRRCAYASLCHALSSDVCAYIAVLDRWRTVAQHDVACVL